MFNHDTFKASFQSRIATLEKAESTTREELRNLSRECLFALHGHENIDVVNKLVAAKLTAINKKALILFFKEFTGFHSQEINGEVVFTKKNKAVYDEKKEYVIDLLNSDPLFNFWTWADRNIEIERKPMDMDKALKRMNKVFKDAEAGGLSKSDLLIALFKSEDIADALPKVLEALVPTQE